MDQALANFGAVMNGAITSLSEAIAKDMKQRDKAIAKDIEQRDKAIAKDMKKRDKAMKKRDAELNEKIEEQNVKIAEQNVKIAEQNVKIEKLSANVAKTRLLVSKNVGPGGEAHHRLCVGHLAKNIQKHCGHLPEERRIKLRILNFVAQEDNWVPKSSKKKTGPALLSSPNKKHRKH